MQLQYFQGLNVIDLSMVWVGPAVGRMLADLGANVIKVERPVGPDSVRTAFVANNDTSGDYWNRSPCFAARNPGKRGIVLDLRQEQGRGLLWRLLEDADVLLENFSAGVIDRIGFGFDEIHRRFPRIVMVSISGYGRDGPNAGRPALGMSLEPASGVVSVTGYGSDAPLKSGQTWVDPYAGLHTMGALLMALMYRERTGRGQYLELAMQEATVPLMAEFVTDYHLNGRVARPRGARRPGMVRGTYPSKGDDDFIAISVRNDAQWQAFCGAVRHEEWSSDSRFATAQARYDHHDTLDALIAEWTRERTKFEATHLLQAAGVPAGPVLKADEIFRHEQLLAREFFDPIDLPGVGALPIQRYVTPKIDGQGVPARGPAPKLGEHTDEVLSELGLGADELATLRANGVLGGEPEDLMSEIRRTGSTLPFDKYIEQGSILRMDPTYRDVGLKP
jgi:crotonobetainyl-CoA:carnitine CoA-transferase CaiB-like acyl-CoA transferase